jgi:hypothetical protein
MSTFGPWFFDVQKQDQSFAAVGQITIDFTAPAGSTAGSFSFTYAPDQNQPVIGPISMTVAQIANVNNQPTYQMQGTLTPSLVIPAGDPDAGTYTQADFFFIPNTNAFWGIITSTGANPTVAKDEDVNVEASLNPPVDVELKKAVAGGARVASTSSY